MSVMNRLVFWRDDDGSEYISVVTQQEYYAEITQADIVGDVDLDSLNCDFGSWPTDRPLSADF